MSQKTLQKDQAMSPGAYVEDAADFANALTLSEMIRAGDYGHAMRRLSRKLNVGYSTLYVLRYGKAKTINTADFVRLGQAYGKKQTGSFVPRTALGRLLVGAADALDRVADEVDRKSAEMDRPQAWTVGE